MKKTIITCGVSLASFVIAGAISFGAAGAANAVTVAESPIVSISGSAGIIAD